MSGEKAITGFLMGISAFCYEHVFRRKFGDEAKKFTRNLFYLFGGTSIATAAGFALNIIAGRLLGPAEYGKVALVQSVTLFLSIPMLLGFSNAMVKFASESSDDRQRSRVISTASLLTGGFVILSAVICLIFSSFLSRMFSTSGELFLLSLVCAVLYTFYTMVTNALKALFKIKTYAFFQPAYALLVLSIFVFLVFIKGVTNFRAIIYPTIFGYAIIGILLSVSSLRPYLHLQFDWKWAKTLAAYSSFAAIGGLSFVFYTNVDKILINRYLTVSNVGIYRAYFVSSVNITVLLWAMFNTIYFPTISRYKDKTIVFNQINKVIPYLLGLGLPLMFICEFVILSLYGRQYPIDPLLMLLFAFAAVLVVWYGLYDWTFTSEGTRGVRIGLLGTVTIAVLNLLLNICLIPRYALYGAVGAQIFSFIFGIYCLHVLKKKIAR